MLEDSSLQVESPQAPVDMESDDICWICLDGTKDRDPLISPCRCPRKVHPRCLARWQLQQAGRLEETNCRFCQSNLADWKASLTPENLKPDVQRVQPIMVVYFEGQIHRIPVKQGPDGLKEFTHRIRELFRLPDDVDISLTFGCKEPLSGQHLKLEGIGAFDAAVHCASVAAAERQQKLKSGGGGTTGGAAPGNDAPAAAAPVVPPTTSPVVPAATAASAAAAADSATSGYPPSSRHHHHHNNNNQLTHHHTNNHLERAARAAAGGIGTAPSSAPVSTQTSGGGAGGAVAAGAGSGALHAAASAPVLSNFASDSNLLASSATTLAYTARQLPESPRAQLDDSSIQGCVSQPTEAASAHSSNGGGAAATAASPGDCQQQQQQQQRRRQASALSQASPAQRRSSGEVAVSSFQAAPLGGPVYDGRPSAAEDEGHPQQQSLVSHLTAPLSGGGSRPAAAVTAAVPSASEPPLAGSLSEHFSAGLSSTATRSTAADPHILSPFARVPPPCAQYPASAHQQRQQQQHSEPVGYSGFPYSTTPNTSPYAAPLLPPLLSPAGSGTGLHLRRGSDLALFHMDQQQQQQQQCSASPSLSSLSSLAASAVPLTPRDHYVACRDAEGQQQQQQPGAASSVSQPEMPPQPHRHQRLHSMGSGYAQQMLLLQQQQQQQQQQQRSLVQDISEPAAAAAATASAVEAAAMLASSSGSPQRVGGAARTASGSVSPTTGSTICTSSTSSIHSASPEVGPSTPNHYLTVKRPTGTPTSAPLTASSPALGTPAGSPPLSPIAPLSRHLNNLGSCTSNNIESLKDAGATKRPGGGRAGAAACDDGGRLARRVAAGATAVPSGLACARGGEYDCTSAALSCGGSAAAAIADDVAALGSLTGRLKTSLRAFSRKVARSLNFQRVVTGPAGAATAAAAAAAAAAQMMGPSVVAGDTVAAAAAAESEVDDPGSLLPQADAEAEVEEVLEPTAAAAAPRPSATPTAVIEA